jgi:hypothetical protein
MSVRMSAAVVLTAATAGHATASGASHSLVQDNTVKATCVGVDLLSGASEISAALSGSASKKFKPKRAIIRVTAQTGAGATGNSQVQIGTATGLADIMPATVMTGLQTVGQCFEVNLAGLFPEIVGNAPMFAQCVVPDGTGTTMAATVEIEGIES